MLYIYSHTLFGPIMNFNINKHKPTNFKSVFIIGKFINFIYVTMSPYQNSNSHFYHWFYYESINWQMHKRLYLLVIHWVLLILNLSPILNQKPIPHQMILNYQLLNILQLLSNDYFHLIYVIVEWPGLLQKNTYTRG